MRDTLKNKEYFEEYIENKYRLSKKRFDRLYNNEISKERIPIALADESRKYLEVVIAKYSAGYSVKYLHKDYDTAVDYMHQSWMVLDNRAYLKDQYFNHYFGSDYDLMLWILSIGFLLNADIDVFNKLVEIVDKYPVRDLLYETVIKAKISARPAIEQESYQLIMDMPFVYEKLRCAIYCNDDKWGKIDAAEYMRLFLKDDFYQRHKDFSFYGHHKSTANIYYGYWSFETAAIAKILNVDVSSFENNKYFPKDMYYYAKQNEI
jgi:hypothetical protein